MHVRMNGFFLAPPRKRLFAWLMVIVLLGIATPRLRRENFLSEGGETAQSTPLPEFPSGQGEWVGTAPLSTADMRGRVWVLKVWTFGCVNCIRSIPFTNELTTRFGDDVQVLGIHSPEFDWERDPVALEQTLAKFDVRFPSYIDQSLDYFFALESPGWPVYLVVDRQTRIRGRWFGEVHVDTRRDREMTALIERLIDED